MTFAQEIYEINNIVSSNVDNAKSSLVESGYNSKNITCMSIKNNKPMNYQLVIVDDSCETFDLHIPNIPVKNEYDGNFRWAITTNIWAHVKNNKLGEFYTQDSLQTLTNHACKHDYNALAEQFNFDTVDDAIDLCLVALYDIIVFVDNCPNTDVEILKQITTSLGFFSSLMDEDGITIRFSRSDVGGYGICTKDHVNDLFQEINFDNSYSIDTEFEKKVINDIILPYVHNGNASRPVLVIILLDKLPTNKEKFFDMLNYYSDSKKVFGIKSNNSVKFSIAQISNNEEVENYLDNNLKNTKIHYTMKSQYNSVREFFKKIMINFIRRNNN